jgi:hypothetical protein
MSSTNIDAVFPSLYQFFQSQSLFAPPFHFLRHQQNVCHPAVNHFARQTLATVNMKHFFMNIFASSLFAHKKRKTEPCSSVIYSSNMVTMLTTETSL